MSPIRQTVIISLIAVLASFTFTSVAYLAVFGLDDRFWRAMGIAIMVPWGVTIPLCFYASKQRFSLTNLTNQLQNAQIKLHEVNKALEQRANFDGMTGLHNRDSFLARLDQMRARQMANILMIVDVDHFKEINDNYGHAAGDQALILVANIFRKVLRRKDLVGRIGGEEFAIFLPGTSPAEGKVIADMVRYEIENTIFEPYHKMRHVITVSIGLTDISSNQDRSERMAHADTALFAAKRRGRNKVVLFEPGMLTELRPFHGMMRDLH